MNNDDLLKKIGDMIKPLQEGQARLEQRLGNLEKGQQEQGRAIARLEKGQQEQGRAIARLEKGQQKIEYKLAEAQKDIDALVGAVIEEDARHEERIKRIEDHLDLPPLKQS